MEFFTDEDRCGSTWRDLSDCKIPATTVLMHNVNAVESLVKKQFSQNDLNIVRFGHRTSLEGHTVLLS